MDGFKKAPVGLGPYKFVSHTPGIELVMEAFDGYWRKVPSVKRLVYKSVPEATTRLAMLKRGEVDVAYLLDATLAEEVKRDPSLKLAFSRRHRDLLPRFPGPVGSEVAVARQTRAGWRPASRWIGAGSAWSRPSAPPGRPATSCPARSSSPSRSSRIPTTPARAKALLAEAGYPNGFDAGDLHPWPPYFSTGEAIVANLGAVGIKMRLRTMERAAFYSALATKKLKGICMCVNAVYGNAGSRLSQTVPAEGAYTYGAYPDIETLYRQQATELDKKKRAAMLAQIQTQLYERVRFAAIYDYIWPSGIGPRVEDPALMLIDPYPWSAPLEEVKLKKR